LEINHGSNKAPHPRTASHEVQRALCAPLAGRRSARFAGFFADLRGAARPGFSRSTERRSASMRFTTFVGAAAWGGSAGGKPACLRFNISTTAVS
jgi:hypothetical protein